MKLNQPVRCVLWSIAGSLLALGLAACDDKVPPKAPPIKESTNLMAPPNTQPEPLKPQSESAAKPDPSGKTAADKDLAAKVKATVAGTPGLQSMTLDVSADDGAVTLFGTADAQADRSKAEQVAAGVPGVKSVDNKIAVVKGS